MSIWVCWWFFRIHDSHNQRAQIETFAEDMDAFELQLMQEDLKIPAGVLHQVFHGMWDHTIAKRQQSTSAATEIL